jgi:uncharacterized protein YebE (UPF0316 family)
MEDIFIPILIFFARIFDVSISTLRIMLLNKGQKFIAPLLGFFEALIWVIVISQVMKNLDSPINYIVYAGGFAMGTLVGILLEKKLAVGTSFIQVITKKEASNLVKVLRAKKLRIASVKAQGNDGPVNILYIMTRRKDLDSIFKMIRFHNPRAFVTVEELTVANNECMQRKKAFRRVGKTK